MTEKKIDPSLLDDVADLDALLGNTLSKVDKKLKDYSVFTKEQKTGKITEESINNQDADDAGDESNASPVDWVTKKDDALLEAEAKVEKTKIAKDKLIPSKQDWEDEKI